MRTLILFGCLCAFLCAVPASAKVAAIPIEDLVTESDEIVVAVVTEAPPGSTSDMKPVYASAVVQRTLKGSLAGTFRFLAAPTWSCDISSAVKGETVLLFLKRQDDSSFIIQHAGRGRMPLRVVGGRTYVTLWNDIRLPHAAPTVAGPDPKYDFIVSVELTYVEALILKQKGRPNKQLQPIARRWAPAERQRYTI